MLRGATNSEEGKIKILLRIVTFVTKNSEAEKLDLQMGQPRRETDLTNAISVQEYARGHCINAKLGRWGGVLKIENLLLEIAQKF